MSETFDYSDIEDQFKNEISEKGNYVLVKFNKNIHYAQKVNKITTNEYEITFLRKTRNLS